MFILFLIFCSLASPALAEISTENSNEPTQTSVVGTASGTGVSPVLKAEVPQEKSWQIAPQLSVISPKEIVLRNDQYHLEYSQRLAGLPSFSVGFLGPIARWEDFQVLFFGRIGYATKETEPDVVNAFGRESGGNVRLHWVPASVGTEIRYSLSDLPTVKPTLVAGMGVDYLYQTGSLPNVSASFFVPYYFLMPGITFVSDGVSDWFGGFTFGVAYHDSFASIQTVRAFSFDLILKVNL